MDNQTRKYKLKETFDAASAGRDQPALRFLILSGGAARQLRALQIVFAGECGRARRYASGASARQLRPAAFAR